MIAGATLSGINAPSIAFLLETNPLMFDARSLIWPCCPMTTMSCRAISHDISLLVDELYHFMQWASKNTCFFLRAKQGYPRTLQDMAMSWKSLDFMHSIYRPPELRHSAQGSDIMKRAHDMPSRPRMCTCWLICSAWPVVLIPMTVPLERRCMVSFLHPVAALWFRLVLNAVEKAI